MMITVDPEIRIFNGAVLVACKRTTRFILEQRHRARVERLANAHFVREHFAPPLPKGSLYVFVGVRARVEVRAMVIRNHAFSRRMPLGLEGDDASGLSTLNTNAPVPQ